MKLRPYQENIINLVRNEIKSGNRRVLMVLPTGGGKSHTMGYIAAQCVGNGHKVLALMHRRQLVTQLCERFDECGVDPAMIMAGEDHCLDRSCQVATCQTYGRRLKLHEPSINPFHIDASVVLIDEAHHALSKTYQNILEYYKDKIIIGVTATPVLSSGVGMGNFFNAIVSPTSVKDLITDDYLVPGEYYGPGSPDLSKVPIMAGDYQKKALNEVMSNPTIIGDVVTNWMRIAGGLRTMVFAVKVSHSKALTREFMYRGVSAEHLDAHSDDEKREETLNRFRSGETQVLCNVGLYTEGTDIPEIECIDIARPTKSMGLYLQMLGRGARPYPGKERFIAIYHGDNFDDLGFYEDDRVWSLDGKKPGCSVVNQRKKERHILNCDNCSCAFTGPVCPQCGTPIKNYGKKIEAMDAELERLDGPKKKQYTREDKIRWFGMLDYYRRTKDYAPGWTAWKYKEKFGCWPKGLKSVGPIEPDQEVTNWIKHLNIKAAYARKKQVAA